MVVMRAASERAAAWLRALGRPWEIAVFLWVPFLICPLVVGMDLGGRHSLGDWEIFRTAGRATLHGHSPYSAADPAALARFDRFAYPPITAVLISPIAALPDEAG